MYSIDPYYSSDLHYSIYQSDSYCQCPDSTGPFTTVVIANVQTVLVPSLQ